MARNAAHHISVLVIDFALEHAVAEPAIVLGGRNFGFEIWPRIEAGSPHAQRREDLLRGKRVDRQPSSSRQQLGQNDEADIAVAGACSGLGRQARRERGVDQILASAGEFEQLFVCGQSAGVRQQHADGHRPAFGLLMLGRQGNELRHSLRHRLIQRQLAAFVKQHRDRGCRNHFG